MWFSIFYLNYYIFFPIHFTYMGVLAACMPVHHLYAYCPRRSKEGTMPPRIGIQMVVSCYESAGNLGPLEEQVENHSPISRFLTQLLKIPHYYRR